MKLILVRHGNTFEEGHPPLQVGARTDLPLTAQGHQQAERMAGYLKASGIVPKAIYTGPLKRQTATAASIAKTFGLEVRYEPALTEIDYGAWEGLPAEEIALRWPREQREWNEGVWQSHIFAGSREKHQKAIDGWLDLLRNKGEETVVGVTSNGLLRFFRNEKVKTGHFCELDLFGHGLKIIRWNIFPEYVLCP